MNQIGHLADKDFEELTNSELIEVVQFFDEENKYGEFENFLNNVNGNTVLETFEDIYHDRHELESFFNYWNK